MSFIAQATPRFLLPSTLLIATALVAVRPPSAHAQHAGATPGTDETAVRVGKKRFEEGLRASVAGDHETARVAFTQAYALLKLPEILANLGGAEVQSGHHVEGARHLAEYLRGKPAETETAQLRQRTEQLLAEAESNIARLTIDVDSQGADILVDGQHIGKAPLGFAWHVAPGFVTVVARQGAAEHSKEVDARAARTTAVSLTLASTAEPAHTPTSEPTPHRPMTPPPDDGPRAPSPAAPTVLLITASAATLASATAWFFTAKSVSTANADADRLLASARATGDPSPCLTPSAAVAPTCTELTERIEDGKTATHWRNTSAIATGAFAAATGAALLYFLRTRNDTKTKATRRVELGFSLTPRSTALSATGSF
jgi:hypothetical protein